MLFIVVVVAVHDDVVHKNQRVVAHDGVAVGVMQGGTEAEPDDDDYDAVEAEVEVEG